MKHIHFVSGLPRSGSTLLCNLLMQNPRFHATATSGLLDALLLVRNQWDSIESFVAAPNDEGKRHFMRGAFNHYFNTVERGIVFDKHRAWPAYAEMAEMLLGRKPKIIVTVRDLREVLVSFELLWRAGAALRPLSQEQSFGFQWATLEGRCDVWCDRTQPVGASYNWIKDALTRGWKDSLHFVDFNDLTSNPYKALRGVYDFLGEKPFNHDFTNVQHLIQPEFDHVRRMPTLHTIRPTIEPVPSRWKEVLGMELGAKFGGQNFWEPKPAPLNAQAYADEIRAANNGNVDVQVLSHG